MAILGRTDLGYGYKCQAVVVDHDPATTPTDAPEGSLIIYSGAWYRKLSHGIDTNVEGLAVSGFSGSAGSAGPSGYCRRGGPPGRLPPACLPCPPRDR